MKMYVGGILSACKVKTETVLDGKVVKSINTLILLKLCVKNNTILLFDAIGNTENHEK